MKVELIEYTLLAYTETLAQTDFMKVSRVRPKGGAGGAKLKYKF